MFENKVYKHKMNDHANKLRQSYSRTRSAAKPTRRGRQALGELDKIIKGLKRAGHKRKPSSAIVDIIVSQDQYEKFEAAGNDTVVLNVISASDIKSKQTKPFTGDILVILR